MSDITKYIAEKNALLRSVISRIEDKKPRRIYRYSDLHENISLTIHPLIPAPVKHTDFFDAE